MKTMYSLPGHPDSLKRILLYAITFCIFSPLTTAAQSLPPKEENSMRILSYNVRNCRGMDDVVDYNRVASAINRISPDVVAIQELDSITTRHPGKHVLEELGRRTLMHATYAPAIGFQGGKYGIGVLSKEKPLSHRTLPLPGREESRVLQIVEFDRYYLCNTHFSLTEEDRKESAAIILRVTKELPKPVFLAGDMNATPDSETQAAFLKGFVMLNNPKQNTFPADSPKTCIDYIYGRRDSTFSTLARGVVDEPSASDHRPLYVDVRLKAEKNHVFRTKPYLQNPVGDGITVSWFTNVPVQSWVEYGVGGQLNLRKELFVDGQMICNNKHHKIRLTGLQAGKTYSYRVCSREISLYEAYKKEFGETVYSDVYTFRMPSEGDEDFTALIFNDIHKRNVLVDMFGKQFANINYDFVFFNGDCIDDPKNEAEAIGFLSYMNEAVKAEKVPVFYMRGNHEIRNAYSIELRNLIDYVGNKTYGAFNWGDTRIVMLDCGEDKPDSHWVYYGLNDFEQLRKDQADFLREELKNKSFKRAAKRVLIHHVPIYGTDDEYNPCLGLWGGVLGKAPFDVCINGHTHKYAFHPKGELGNNYPVVIGGGNRPETATMMVLQKKGKEMKLTVFNTKGEEILKLEL